MTLAFISQGDAAYVCGHGTLMNKWNGRDILYVPEGEPGQKKSWSHFKTRFVSRWVAAVLSFYFFIMENYNSHDANVAQVQNTQTLSGSQEVEYFCQILFLLKFLQLFLPHRWRWLFLLSIMELCFWHFSPRTSSLQNACCKSLAISDDIEHSHNPNCLQLEGIITPKNALLYAAFSTNLMPEIVFVDLPLTKGRFGDFPWAMEQLVPGFPSYSYSN